MNVREEGRPEASAVSWWGRRAVDAVVLVALALTLFLLQNWRQEQLAGYGLDASFRGAGGRLLSRVRDPFGDVESGLAHLPPAAWRGQPLEVRWSGRLAVPRPGRYRLQVSGNAVAVQLEVAGKRARRGGRGGSWRLAAGSHRLELVARFAAAAPPRLRLLWARGGGAPRYVPPTLLRPHGSRAAAKVVPPRDGPCLFAGLGVLVLALLVWLRRPLRRGLQRLARDGWARVDVLLFVLVVGLGSLLALIGLGDAGQTEGEERLWAAGYNFVHNLLDGDLRPESWGWDPTRPALAKWVFGAAATCSGTLESARRLAPLLGGLCCGLLLLAGRDLVNRGVGLLAAVLAAATPQLLGHARVIGPETLLALCYLATVWTFFRGLQRGGNSGYFVVAGLLAGLTCAAEIVGGTVLIVLAGVYVVSFAREIRTTRQLPISLTLGTLPLVAAVTFLAVNPPLWLDPLGGLAQLLLPWGAAAPSEPFLGGQGAPPWFYLPLYVAVTMPVGALAMVALGLGRVVRRRRAGEICVALWFVAPFAVGWLPAVGDGVRYALPALPAACLLGAARLAWLGRGVARLLRDPVLATPATAVLGTMLGFYVFQGAAAVHPHCLDYYSELVGGPAAVARERSFVLGWRGQGLEQAADFVARRAGLGATVMVDAAPRAVIKLRSDLREVSDPTRAEFVIHNRRGRQARSRAGLKPAFVVRARGAPLAWVYRRVDGAKRRRGFASPAGD